jgi:gas vesicle protein
MNEEKISPPGSSPSEAPSGTPQSPDSGLQQIAKETAQTAKTKIETLKNAAKEQGGAAVEEIQTVAQTAAREAQEAGRDFLQEQKESLAQKVDKYTEALRATSERLRVDEGNVLADPAQKAAEQLERMSSYLRDKEPGDFLYDLESYARRRPEVVFGGLFVVGLAAARFLKASRKRPRHTGPLNQSATRVLQSSLLQLPVPRLQRSLSPNRRLFHRLFPRRPVLRRQDQHLQCHE